MKRIAYLLTVLALVLGLTGCVPGGEPAGATPEVPATDEPTAAPTPEATPEPATGPTAEPTTAPTAEPAALTEESCAYITAMSMCMDGTTDITFDYVDWLGGEEAEQAYIEDHPGAIEQDIEDANIQEIGYIRNVNPMLRTYRTRTDTRYYLPGPDEILPIAEVDYDTFRDRMFPAVEGIQDTYLTFVKVYVTDGTIDSIEWLYLP